LYCQEDCTALHGRRCIAAAALPGWTALHCLSSTPAVLPAVLPELDLLFCLNLLYYLSMIPAALPDEYASCTACWHIPRMHVLYCLLQLLLPLLLT
jgi:hypothetical protein